MPFSTRKTALAAAAAFGLLALAACGGGGGGGAPAKTAMEPAPETPTPTPTPTAPTPAPVASGPPLERLQGIIGKAIDDDRLGVSGTFGVGLEGGELDNAPKSDLRTEASKESRVQSWLHYLFDIPRGYNRELSSTIRSPKGIELGDEEHMSDAAFKQYEKLFGQDFGLHPYDNEWDGIGTARINEISYCSPSPYPSGGDATPCAPGILRNPTGSLSDENGGVSFIYSRNSDVAYLQYSAFFLNYAHTTRATSTYNNPGDRYLTGDLEEPYGPATASVGSLTPLTTPMATGIWKGGMIGAAYEDPRNVERHCGDTCTYEQLSPRPLTGDVTFTLRTAIASNDPQYGLFPYEIEFSNIVDSRGEKMAGWTWRGGVTVDNGGAYVDLDRPLFLRVGAGSKGEGVIFDSFDDSGSPVGFGDSSSGAITGSFYGPNYKEIGGIFSRDIPAEDVTEGRNEMKGAFGARRQ